MGSHTPLSLTVLHTHKASHTPPRISLTHDSHMHKILLWSHPHSSPTYSQPAHSHTHNCCTTYTHGHTRISRTRLSQTQSHACMHNSHMVTLISHTYTHTLTVTAPPTLSVRGLDPTHLFELPRALAFSPCDETPTLSQVPAVSSIALSHIPSTSLPGLGAPTTQTSNISLTERYSHHQTLTASRARACFHWDPFSHHT